MGHIANSPAPPRLTRTSHDGSSTPSPFTSDGTTHTEGPALQSTLTGPGCSGCHHRERSVLPPCLSHDAISAPPIALGAEYSADFPSVTDLSQEGSTPGVSAMEVSEHTHTHVTPRLESGLSYATALPSAKQEDNQDRHDQGDPFFSDDRLSAEPSPWTSEQGSRHPDHPIGDIDSASFGDIRPPTWGDL